ncbi:MAG: LysR family transcriptional regulator [Pigmentiphaga sp.]|uniref:LysR family transcriptional regulator n=1 Tax=Pigmentiphaga sp. TaxID=1977564 RepID=UPI003B55E0D5
MELRHLRSFTYLAEILHFTRAAERVHVTQSTLSHQIKQLEDEVGCPLFDRCGKKVVLTEEGEFFLAYATRALREIDQGLSVLKHSGDEISGLVRIGTTHTFNLSFLPQCIGAFIADYPTVHISVIEDSANSIEAQLRSGTLDIGITYQPIDTAGLHFEALYDEQMVRRSQL